MTTHQLTHPQLPQQNWSNYATNVSFITFSRFFALRFLFVPKHDGKRFTSNEAVIAATEAYFSEFDKTYFLDGLKKLEYR